MQNRLKQNLILSAREFEDYKKSDAVPCPRIAHFPGASWHKPGTPLGETKVAFVFKSEDRVLGLPNGEAMHKPSSHSFFAVKFKRCETEHKAKALIDSHLKATRIPYAKIKPPVLLDEQGFTVGIVMAELKGKTLLEFLFEDKDYFIPRKLTINALETLYIMRETAWSLLWDFHANGITHRDISPANIMIDTSVMPPRVRIYDVDYCKLNDEYVPEGVGTPLFMAPETFYCEHTTEKTDVWSLGWIFYLLLRGQLPNLKTLGEMKEYVKHIHFYGLFSGIESQLTVDEKSNLLQLLSDMFQIDQHHRISALNCLKKLEDVILSVESRNAPPLATINYHSYVRGIQLRNVLVAVAQNTKIGGEPSMEIAEWCRYELQELMAQSYNFSTFLFALRVETLKDTKTPAEFMQRVNELIDNFNTHYKELKKIQTDIDLLYPVLAEFPQAQYPNSLEQFKERINYFLKYYEPYSWSLDSLAMLDKKIIKMLNEIQPIMTLARQELATFQAARLHQSSYMDWQHSMWPIKHAQQAQREVADTQISDQRMYPGGKRRML